MTVSQIAVRYCARWRRKWAADLDPLPPDDPLYAKGYRSCFYAQLATECRDYYEGVPDYSGLRADVQHNELHARKSKFHALQARKSGEWVGHAHVWSKANWVP